MTHALPSRLLALAILAGLPLHAGAQEPPAAPRIEEPETGLDRLPSVGELREQAERALGYLSERLSPLLEDLEAGVEDLPAYGPPQVMPNGDILIPRKRDEDGPAPPPADDGAPPSISL